MDEKTGLAVAAVSLSLTGFFQVVCAVVVALLIWKYLLQPTLANANEAWFSFWNDVEKEADKIQKEKEQCQKTSTQTKS